MLEDLFKNSNLRLTLPRRLIFAVLQKNHKPQSAQDIHKKIKKQVDLASVYRNLLVFERLEIIQREHRNGEDYFYLSAKKHHHITCLRCGRSECVPCEHKIKVKNFINIKHDLILTGVCTRCVKLV